MSIDITDINDKWMWVKYQVINNCFGGVKLMLEDGSYELCSDVCCPGSGLIFNNEKSEIMKELGYFQGKPRHHMGESWVTITEKAIHELELEKLHFTAQKERLTEMGFKLFMMPNEIEEANRTAHTYIKIENYKKPDEWERQVAKQREYLLEMYGVYLIPENALKNIKVGTQLISSIDGASVIYDGNNDLKVKAGYSTYGIRLWPSIAIDFSGLKL